MNKSILRIGLPLLLMMAVAFSSCFNDLDTEPIDPNVSTSASVYTDANAYKQVLAKVYAVLAVSGQQGPAGQPDIAGIDEGFSNYLRQYWKAQELTTDEAVIAWNDGNLQDYHQQDWNANNEFVTAMYNRIFYLISVANELIRESTDAKLSERGIVDADANAVRMFRAEARFMRALAYWHALDMFRGNVPFVTDEDAVGAFFPEQTNANNLFSYIESELMAIESELAAPGTNEYARADQAAAWMLLAKLYLNAEVYGQGAKYTECLTYCSKIVNESGLVLHPVYQELFMADNHNTSGVIFPVAFDGVHTKTFGGTTFLIHAAVGGSMDPAAFGIDGGWGGTRTTAALVDKFPSIGGGEPIAVPNEGNSASYAQMNVPGGHQGWDPAAQPTLASVNGDNKYEGYVYFPDDNTEFKFALGGWEDNWGDNEADGMLDAGGGNIVTGTAGVYRLNMDTENLTYSVEATNWGVIGNATPGGWDSDTDMTYNPTENAFEITMDLVPGEMKFRANDAWDVDFGDNGADGILEYGGANIVIPNGGTYILKLYLDRPDYTYGIELLSFDSRAMFYTDGQSLEINERGDFNQGYAVTKFTNLDRNGVVGSDITFPDTDFPLFRLADAHLMYAEAVLRGGSGGDAGTAVGLVNQVLQRAYDGAGGNITEADLTLDFILDERARELYWEGHRRTDLIRFGRFSNTDYLWPLKGGAVEGRAVSDCYDVFPVPSADLGANPNLEQWTEGGNCY